MSIFGISDPYILAGYIGCVLTVLLCVAWAIKFGNKEGSEEE
jgi:hypothetical protein